MKFHLIFSILILASLTLSACAPVSQADLQSTVEIAIALTALAQTAAAPAATTAAPIIATVEPTSEPPVPVATEAPGGPEVVFLAEGSFSADEKAQIVGRVIDPFILYHQELADYPQLLTITIEKYDGLAGFGYAAEAIFETGVYAGWLVPVTGVIVDWWLPECLGPCVLSDYFRAAYPEIVAILEP